MKLENNWKNKPLENLEKDVWPALDPTEGSYLIKKCNALRKKQLRDFTIEDLRIMIGQDIGLKFLAPMAIEILEQNIFAEGDNYEGDLVKSVLTSDTKYWSNERKNWAAVCNLVDNNYDRLQNSDTTWQIKKGWFDSYKAFKEIK